MIERLVGPVDGKNTRVVGNLIGNFAGDGMRGLGDFGVFEGNTVRNRCNVNNLSADIRPPMDLEGRRTETMAVGDGLRFPPNRRYHLIRTPVGNRGHPARQVPGRRIIS